MINTEHLLFEKPSPNDFQRFYEINSDPETNLYNPHGPMSFEEAKIQFNKVLNHWEEFGFGTWKIVENENPDFVIGFGGISYRNYGEETKLNLGYRLDKISWGKGYATLLGTNAINWAFQELDVNEIFALVRPTNLASIRVLEKCQMTLVDTLDDVPHEEKSLVFRITKARI